MPELHFAESKLQILSCTRFSSSRHAPESGATKNQYQYRLLFLQKGNAVLDCNGSQTDFAQNALLFLPPNCPYRIVSASGDCTFLSVWFSFLPDTAEVECETQQHASFDESRCAPRYTFPDAPCFDNAFLWIASKYTATAFLNVYNEWVGQKPFGAQRAAAQLLLLFSDTVRLHAAAQESDDPARDRLDSIFRYINAHITDKIDCADIAERFSCHPNHLNRIVKAETGVSVKQYILNEKLRYARRLLQETSLTVKQVAAATGFFDASHFTKCYKQAYGIAPTKG